MRGLVRVVWCGVVWCGVVWCGVVWCGVVWCGVVWCGVHAHHVDVAPGRRRPGAMRAALCKRRRRVMSTANGDRSASEPHVVARAKVIVARRALHATLVRRQCGPLAVEARMLVAVSTVPYSRDHNRRTDRLEHKISLQLAI
jgi:hypothetical protein